MGNFREHNRRGSFNAARGDNDRFGGRGNGGFRGNSGFGGRRAFGKDRNSERRGPSEMFDVTCSKCEKRCQVPFRPTGSKPVFCSDCFRQNEGSSNSFSPRNSDRPAQGISKEQFNEINAKLDKILAFLENLEVEIEDAEEDPEDDDLDNEE